MGSWRVNIAQHGTTTIAQAATGFSGVLTSPIERLNQPTNINRPQSNEIKTYQNNIHQYPTNIHTHTQNGYIMLHLPDLHMNGGLWMNRPKESKPAASWFSYVMLQQEWRDPWSSFEMSAFGKSCWVMIWSSRDVTPGNCTNTRHSHSSSCYMHHFQSSAFFFILFQGVRANANVLA